MTAVTFTENPVHLDQQTQTELVKAGAKKKELV